MKKILPFAWTIILTVIISYFVFVKLVGNKSRVDFSINLNEKNNLFSCSELNNRLLKNEYLLLTIGAEDCSLCDILLYENKTVNKYPVARYYICKDLCDTNNLVSQALRTSGFPTSYIIDKQYNIVGEITGIKDFSERFSSIMNETPQSTANDMLNYSFKALLAYFKDDFENMYSNAVNSRKHGDYFFNNYLMYLYWNRTGIKDSIDYYKNAALNTLEGADIFIYKSLIHEIDAENELLKQIENYSSNHVHDQNCGHQH